MQATEVDGGNPLTGSLAVTVAVTDVNEPPTVTGNATPSVPENMTAVATYSATDPEEVPPSWSLQGGAGVFMITSAGALAFTTAPNYEVESSYTVTVRASDGVNTTNHPVTVTVTDVDEDEELKFSARRPLIGADYTAAFKEGMGDAVTVSNVGVGALDEPQRRGDGHHRGDGGDVPSGGRRPRQLPARDRLLRRWAQREDPAGDLRVAHVAGQREQHAAGVPEPPVRGRRDRPLGRRERDRGNGRRPGAAGDRPGARHAQTTPSRLPASPPIRRSRSTPPQGRSRSPAAPHSITRTRTPTASR